jgi:hypothetical protein
VLNEKEFYFFIIAIKMIFLLLLVRFVRSCLTAETQANVNERFFVESFTIMVADGGIFRVIDEVTRGNEFVNEILSFLGEIFMILLNEIRSSR